MLADGSLIGGQRSALGDIGQIITVPKLLVALVWSFRHKLND